MLELVNRSWSAPRDRRRWRLAEGEAMVDALRASGLTMSAFARRHGLHEARVQRWVGRVARRRPEPAAVAAAPVFAPVRLVKRAEPPVLEVAIDGAVIRVRDGFDDALLARVVAVLRGERC